VCPVDFAARLPLTLSLLRLLLDGLHLDRRLFALTALQSLRDILV
jgi:hypothetical protein